MSAYAQLDRKIKRESSLNPIREYSVELGLRTHRPSVITTKLVDPLLHQQTKSPNNNYSNNNSYNNYYNDAVKSGRGFQSKFMGDHDHRDSLLNNNNDALSQCSNRPQYGDLSSWWELPVNSTTSASYEQKTKNVRISYSADEIYGKASLNQQSNNTIDHRASESRYSVFKPTAKACKDLPSSRHGNDLNSHLLRHEELDKRKNQSFQYAFEQVKRENFVTDQQSAPFQILNNSRIQSNIKYRSTTGADDAIKYRTFEEAVRSYPTEDTDDSDASSIVSCEVQPLITNLSSFKTLDVVREQPDQVKNASASSITSEREATVSFTSHTDNELIAKVEARSFESSPKQAWVSVEEIKTQPESSKVKIDDPLDLAKRDASKPNNQFAEESSKHHSSAPEKFDEDSDMAPEAIQENSIPLPVQRNMSINQSSKKRPRTATKSPRARVQSKPSRTTEQLSSAAGEDKSTKASLADCSQYKPAQSSNCHVPPIDLSQLSPRKTQSSKQTRKPTSKSANASKTRTSVQVQVNSPKAQRPTSAYTPKAGDFRNKKQIAREIKLRVQKKSTDIAGEIKRRVQQKTKDGRQEDSTLKSGEYIKVDEREVASRSYLVLNSFRGYDRFNEMSPRIESGEISRWQCLPEELWLHILSFLTQPDRHSFMLTCSDFNRLSHDRSLWKEIVITKKQLSDDEMIKLGYLHPNRLSIEQCSGIKVNGDLVSNRGMREMFSSCGNDLKHLSTASCVMPPLSGEAMLHHAVIHCTRIQSLNISWCNLTNRDIELIAENFTSLRLLCLNGNQAVTDIAMTKIFRCLWSQLEQLELQGCFKLTNQSLQEIGQCVNLRTLNIGQCHKFSSSCIMSEVSRLSYLEVCNLKGLKQLKDSCITGIVKSCPSIKHLVIAQCTALSPKSLLEISCALSSLSSLDVSSCKDCVNDASISAMLANCCRLTSLDLSSTPITNQSVTALSNSCRHLCELRLNFCSITDSCIKELLALNSLKKLSVYGVKGIQLNELADINPHVFIEI